MLNLKKENPQVMGEPVQPAIEEKKNTEVPSLFHKSPLIPALLEETSTSEWGSDLKDLSGIKDLTYHLTESLTKYFCAYPDSTDDHRKILEEKVQELQNLISSALHSSSVDKCEQLAKIHCDTFVFGDVHARLDIFLKNLYAADLIDKKGNWIPSDKTMIQLGDVIDRGNYSLETILYLNALQKQAKEGDGTVVCLLGNHEQYLIDFGKACASGQPAYDEKTKEIIINFLKKEISDGSIKLIFSNSKKNIVASHSEISKTLMLKMLRTYCEHKKISCPFEKGEKVDSLSIYSFMDTENITWDDLSERTNEIFHSAGGKHTDELKKLYLRQGDYRSQTPMRSEDKKGILWSREKYTRKKSGAENRCLGIKPHKVVAFCGHTPTESKVPEQFRNQIYVDVGLGKGNYQGFVAMQQKESLGIFYSVFLKDGNWEFKMLGEQPEKIFTKTKTLEL